LPTTLADLATLRRAINEDWDVPLMVRKSIVDELAAEVESNSVRRIISVAKSLLAMHRADLRTEMETYADAPVVVIYQSGREPEPAMLPHQLDTQ
jgi:hypothetical protein